MLRPFFLAVVVPLLLVTPSFADDKAKPSPPVKKILDKALGEVRKNRQEFDKANEKPISEAQQDLQSLIEKLVDDGKSTDAQAVLKKLDTLEADLIRMASDAQKPTLKPPLKAILEKAVRHVRRNQEAYDKANQKPFGVAREELENLAKQQTKDGKTKEAVATLQQIQTLDLPPLMEPVSINRVSLPMDRPCPLAEA